MEELITNELDKCVGCNRCLRVCPIDEANITTKIDGMTKIKIDGDKCISCGACLTACHHGSRGYIDDTERFFSDLRSGVPISVMTAPAMKANLDEWGRLLSWFRQIGVKGIYDVSFGADICIWAHIRYLQKTGLKPLITQPCPSIVSYILRHRSELKKYLSPVHSPMCCAAIFMDKYEKTGTRIAAISPCIAKKREFINAGIVDYNVTIAKLNKYIADHNIVFPSEQSGFDGFESGLGSLFPMPGGLKENVEYYLGKSLRIDKSEGPQIVYEHLNEYAHQPESQLPVLFDVLNCQEGCNQGTGIGGGHSIFEINAKMDVARQKSIQSDRKEYLDKIFNVFDEMLKLEDFLRVYNAPSVAPIRVSEADIQAAFLALGKHNEAEKTFDCGACGCDSCYEMAQKVAKGVNTPLNCVEKARHELIDQQRETNTIQTKNLNNLETILSDTTRIKEMTESIVVNIDDITDAIFEYNAMIRNIEKIALQVNIIALNASIEAARAGRHGRAFNVVAEEIRALAQSSSSSAQQTNAASEKAAEAIGAVNEMIVKISENVNASYDNITSITQNTKILLKHEDSAVSYDAESIES